MPPDLTLQDVADKVDDVARVLARQAAAPATAPEQGPDVPLLVDLHALRADALACAATARSRRERDAFGALAGGLERLLTGRGGRVLAPVVGEEFDGRTMEAVEVLDAPDAAADRTVAAVLEPGLAVGPRCVRPSRVAVHRAR